MKLRTSPQRRDVLKAGGLLGLSLAADALRPARAQVDKRFKLNLVTTAGSTSLVFKAMMKQQDFFDQFGPDVTTTNVADGPRLISSLLSGEMDLWPATGFNQVFPAEALLVNG